MIIGGKKHAVAENIRHAIENNTPYKPVETEDPVIDKQELTGMARQQLERMRTVTFKINNFLVRTGLRAAEFIFSRHTQIDGLEKLKDVHGGVLVTANHFNPLENLALHKTMRKAGWKRLYAVSQALNLGMTGWVGYIFKYFDTIPLVKDHKYLSTLFPEAMLRVFRSNGAVLIYPEEQMWFNYRRPRPGRHGVYDYAAQLNVPIVSLFTESIDTGKPEKSDPEFNQTRYIVHVLDTLYPDPTLSPQENSTRMRLADDAQRRAAYERIYGKSIDAPFDVSDIAGWHPENAEPAQEEANTQQLGDEDKKQAESKQADLSEGGQD